MTIEAPYAGRPAPAVADKAEETDKDKAGHEESPEELSADKRQGAPADDEPDEQEDPKPKPEDEEEEEPDDDADTIRMRSDYTRKTQAVAARGRELDARERDIQARETRTETYARVDRLLTAHPELAATHTVAQLVAQLEAGADAAPARGTVAPEVAREIAALRAEVADTKETLFYDRLESAVKRVAKAHGLTKAQMRQMVETAVEDDLVTTDTKPELVVRRLGLVATALTAKTAKVKGQQELVTKLRDKGRAASGTRTVSGAAAEPTQPRAKGWKALVAQHQRRAARTG